MPECDNCGASGLQMSGYRRHAGKVWCTECLGTDDMGRAHPSEKIENGELVKGPGAETNAEADVDTEEPEP